MYTCFYCLVLLWRYMSNLFSCHIHSVVFSNYMLIVSFLKPYCKSLTVKLVCTKNKDTKSDTHSNTVHTNIKLKNINCSFLSREVKPWTACYNLVLSSYNEFSRKKILLFIYFFIITYLIKIIRTIRYCLIDFEGFIEYIVNKLYLP